MQKENGKLKSKLNDLETSNNMTEFDKVRNMIDISKQNYELSKNLCNRINELAQEYRKQTEEVESFEELVDSQEWLIDSCMQASKEFKKSIRQQMDQLTAKLDKLQNTLNNNDIDIVSDKENVRHPVNYRPGELTHGSAQEIQSKEFTNSGEDYEYVNETINDPKI